MLVTISSVTTSYCFKISFRGTAVAILAGAGMMSESIKFVRTASSDKISVRGSVLKFARLSTSTAMPATMSMIIACFRLSTNTRRGMSRSDGVYVSRDRCSCVSMYKLPGPASELTLTTGGNTRSAEKETSKAGSTGSTLSVLILAMIRAA